MPRILLCFFLLLTVERVFAAPLPNPDFPQLCGGHSKPSTFSITANDVNVNPSTVTLYYAGSSGTAVTTPAGSFSVDVLGLVTFIPNPTYAGTSISLNYTVQDPYGNVSGLITITASLTQPIIKNTIQSTVLSVCPGTQLTFTGSSPAGGNGAFGYVWEEDQGPTGTFTPAQGANHSMNYTTKPLTVSTSYQRIVNSGGCTSVSNTIKIVVSSTLSGGNVTPASQQVCSGTAATKLVSSPVTGGDGNYVYNWFSGPSMTGPWLALGVMTPQYAPGVLAATTYFKLEITDPIGCAGTTLTSIRQVTVLSPLSLPALMPSTSTICSGGVSPTFNPGVVSGGNGTYSYSWENGPSATGPWTPVITGVGPVVPPFTPPTITTTTYFRLVVTSGACTGTTVPVVVNVSPGITGNVISAGGPVLICSNTGGPGISLTGTLAGTAGPIAYLWQSSLNGSTWSTASGTNNTTVYNPGVLTTSTYYRLLVSSGSCQSVSNAVYIQVQPVVMGNVLTASTLSVCSGGSPGLISTGALSGGSGTYSYTWQMNTGSGWTLATGSSSTSSTYAPPPLTVTTSYQLIVTSGGCSQTSPPITITVVPGIAGNVISPSVSASCSGAPLVLAESGVLSGGSPTGGVYGYQWVTSTSSMGPFSPAPGASTGSSYNAASAGVTMYYALLVSTPTCTNTSNVATVNPGITGDVSTSPTTAVCTGTAPTPLFLTGTLSGGGAGPYQYQWQSSTTGAVGSFTNVTTGTGGMTAAYTPGPLTMTTYFQLVVSTASCSVTSNGVSIAVSNGVNSVIINSPNGSVCSGMSPGTFTSTVSPASVGYTYQWQYNTVSAASTSWSQNPINVLPSYNPGNLTATTYYRLVVTSGSCSVYSNVITIQATPAISGNSIISQDSVLCYNTVPQSLVQNGYLTGGNGNYFFDWQISPTGNSGSFVSTGATNPSYLPGPLTATTYYRLIVLSGSCMDTSNVWKFLVYPALKAPTIGSTSPPICPGNVHAPLQLSGTVSGGSGSYSYQWRSSLSGKPNSYADVPVAGNVPVYNPGPLNTSTYYQLLVSSGNCIVTSNPVLVAVSTPPTAVGDVYTLAYNQSGAFPLIANDIAGTAAISMGSIDLDTVQAGVQTNVTLSGKGGFTSDQSGNLHFTSQPGFIGLISIPYRIQDVNGCFSNVAFVNITVNPDARADVQIVKEAPQEVNQDKFNYRLTVTNNGPNDVDSITATDTIPQGVNFLYTTQTAGSPSFNSYNNVLNWKIPYLKNGKQAFLTLFVASKLVGTIVNRGFVTSPINDPNLNNNVSTALVTKNPTALLFPTLFTPNGDGVNDVFIVKGLEDYPDNEIQIFNRWGTPVYRAKGYMQNGTVWDGSNLGEGTYYYTAVVNIKGVRKKFGGFTTIARSKVRQ